MNNCIVYDADTGNILYWGTRKDCKNYIIRVLPANALNDIEIRQIRRNKRPKIVWQYQI